MSVRRRLLRDDLLMRVRIDTPGGDPARLSEAQRRRIENIAALTRGEITQAEFLARENPGRDENINSRQEDIMADESSQSSVVSSQKGPEGGDKPKKTYIRKPKVAPAAPATNGHGPGGTVRLTPEQVSKLWEAVTGGKISITTDGYETVIEVTLDSFPKALPVLLDWMGRA